MFSITDDEKSIILGKLLHDERKRQKKSAAVVASLSGISQQYLSEIERGKKNLPVFSIQGVLQTLRLSFNNDLNLIGQADRLLDLMIDAYMNFDRERLLLHIQELVSDKYRHSYAYPYYMAGILAQKCLLEKKEPIPVVPLTHMQKLNMFLYFCAEKAMTDDQESQISALIQNGLSLYTPYKDDPSIAALYAALLCDLSSIYERTNRLFDALDLYQKALAVVSRLYYISFSLSVELNISIIYSKMGQIPLSIQQTLRILRLSEDPTHAPIRNAAKFNLAADYLIAAQYEQCIRFALELQHLPGQDPAYCALYYLLAFSCYMLGNDSDAQKYCALLLAQKSASPFSRKFAYTLSNGLSFGFDIQNLETLFEETLREGDQSDVEMVFRLLTTQLKQESLFQEAIKYYDLYISYRFSQSCVAVSPAVPPARTGSHAP